MKRLLQLLAVIVIVLLVWKKGVPWWQEHHGRSAASTTSANGSCVELAERASEVWGSGIGRFANPPYDLGAWGEFRTRVDAASAKADALCSCDADSCRKSRQAISDLPDPARYATYKEMAGPTLAPYGGRYIVRGGAVEQLEGEWKPSRLVIVEFPNAERAKAWLEGPEYRDARALRHETANSKMIVVEGV